MSTRFVHVDRRTLLLLAPDMREWVPADDMVHVVLEAVPEHRELLIVLLDAVRLATFIHNEQAAWLI